MKYFCLVCILCCFSPILSAQDWLNRAFGYALGYKANDKKEWYKGQVSKGKNLGSNERNGMGILKMKDGRLYIGDIQRNVIHGFGVMFVVEGNTIPNCVDCEIYVGNWKQGVKSGRGSCYDKYGAILYSGKFENDKPVESYPSEIDFTGKYFTFIEYINEVDKYLGEVYDEKLHGFGIFVFGNGNLWFGQFKDGNMNGIGLYLTYSGNWITLNCNGGNCVEITSSAYYANVKAQKRASTAALFSDVLTILEASIQLATETIELVNEIKTEYNTISSSTSSSGSSNTSGSSSSGSSTNSGVGSNSKGKSNDCDNPATLRSKQTDENTYQSISKRLISMKTRTYPYSDGYRDSERTQAQSQMKQIRLKWVNRGCSFWKSDMEDWDGRY